MLLEKYNLYVGGAGVSQQSTQHGSGTNVIIINSKVNRPNPDSTIIQRSEINSSLESAGINGHQKVRRQNRSSAGELAGGRRRGGRVNVAAGRLVFG